MPVSVRGYSRIKNQLKTSRSAKSKKLPPPRPLRDLPHAEHFTARQLKAFLVRSMSNHTAMKARLLKKGLTVPFTCEEFRSWLLPRLHNALCEYCGRKLTMVNFGVDHSIPLSRGGGAGLHNLDLCCKACNRCKGILTPDEFSRLLGFLSQFDPEIKSDVLGRMKAGGLAFKKFMKKPAV